MSRYIDAEELKEEFEDDGHLSGYIEDMIDDVKTADVREVVRGKWEYDTEDKYRCSVCYTKTSVDERMNQPLYKYYPYCGANMDNDE